jgi:hypothetical protein
MEAWQSQKKRGKRTLREQLKNVDPEILEKVIKVLVEHPAKKKSD